MDQLGQLTAQGVGPAVDEHPERPAERRPVHDLQRHPWPNTKRGQVPKRSRVAVLDPLDLEVRASGGIRQTMPPPLLMTCLRLRNGVAVRVPCRMPKRRVDAQEQAIGDRMLEQLRLRGNFVPGHAQEPYEEGLEQPTPTDDLLSVHQPVTRQRQGAAWTAVHQAVRYQPLHHRRGCRGCDVEYLGKPGCADVLPLTGQLEDRLEGVLSGFGSGEPAAREHFTLRPVTSGDGIWRHENVTFSR